MSPNSKRKGQGRRSPAASEAPSASDTIVELCAFRVGSDEYVVDIRRMREVVNPLPIRPVPKAPVCIDGVVDLRGEVVPVVDVRRRLGLPPGQQTQKTKFLIVQVGGRVVALVVDAICDMMRIPRSSIRPAPGLAPLDGPRLFLGVCGGEVAAPVPAGRRHGGRSSGPRKLRLLLNVRALLETAGTEELAAVRRLTLGERGGGEPGGAP